MTTLIWTTRYANEFRENRAECTATAREKKTEHTTGKPHTQEFNLTCLCRRKREAMKFIYWYVDNECIYIFISVSRDMRMRTWIRMLWWENEIDRDGEKTSEQTNQRTYTKSSQCWNEMEWCWRMSEIWEIATVSTIRLHERYIRKKKKFSVDKERNMNIVLSMYAMCKQK